MSFDREIAGYRYAQTHFGDDLRRVALRELGDATRWPDLIALNGLLPPYLTDDPAAAGPGVLLNGAQLLIPAPQSADGATEDPEAVFGVDLQLTDDGALVFDGGRPALSIGWENLLQSVRIRLQARKKDLMFHPEYGSHIHTMLGQKASATANNLAAFYARSAILEDDRVDRVTSCTAEVLGDAINVVATLVAIGGKTSILSVAV